MRAILKSIVQVFAVLTGFLLMPELGLGQIMMSNGSVIACDDIFYDDGDQSNGDGGPYTDSDYVFTICPEVDGDAVSVYFLGFDLQTNANPNNNDVLYVFDGPDNSAPLVGAGSGNLFVDMTITASINNPTGCLTFQLVVNNGATGGDIGWAAEVACVTPCTYPTSSYDLVSPDPFEPGQPSVGVCPDQALTFDGSLSVPDGAPLANYIWNWGDGEVETTSSPVAEHAYAEPGEYLVSLVVEDDNGCSSINLEPYQVLVSTLPIFNAQYTTPLCVGSPGYLDGSPVQSITWTALPPLAVSESEPLPDATGVPFTSELVIDFFDPGQVLENCDDLMSFSAVLEHSFIGDLTMWVTCPDGTEVLVMENGASGGPDPTGCNNPDLGGNDLGEPVFGDGGGSPTPGVGYEYTWSTAGVYVLDDADNPDVAGGGTVPAGLYATCGDICDFEGCPLNGIWEFNVLDQWAADNGFLFEWGIDFNPAIVPGVTTFTPTIGADADSSYWDLDESTYGVSTIDGEADYVELLFDAPGDYSFDYWVTNNFGCAWDTTVNIEVIPGLGNSITAGPDQIFCQTPVQLAGSFEGVIPSSCGGSQGSFSHCYGNNAYDVFSYCPDNPGDGTMMTIDFSAGAVETFFDEVTVYDGPDAASPVLAVLEGDLTGNSFVATNPDGCLTIVFTSDGSVSCGSGSFDESQWCVTCGGQSTCGYNWTWSPSEYLDDPTIPNPTVLDFDGVATEYTLLVEPMDMPNCGTEATVMVLPGFQFDYAVEQPSCLITDGEVLVNVMSPAADGPWNVTLTGGGSLVEQVTSNGGATLFDGLSPGDYVLEVSDDSDCLYEFDIVLEDPPILTLEVSNDTTICIDGTAMLQVWSDMDLNNEWTYTWDNGLGTGTTQFVSPTLDASYTVSAVDEDNCPTEAATVNVYVNDSLSIAQIDGEGLICTGAIAELEAVGAAGGSGLGYAFDWTWQNIPVGGDDAELSHNPSSTGTYCVTLSDNCETPSVTSCFEVVIETPMPPAFSVDTSRACVPGVIQFTLENELADLTSQLWFFGDGEGSADQDPAHAYMSPGNYDVTLEITSNLGCTYTANFPNAIQIFVPPSVGFTASPQPATAPDTEIEFESVNSSNVVGWFWQFDTVADLGISSQADPTFTFPIDRGGLYPVTLVVTDENGCSNQVTRYVEIFDLYNLFIPTSFTPNNDGVNDAFKIEGTDIDPNRFSLQIFNRWGDQVFETSDPAEVWHGPANADSDHFVQDNVYMYRVVVYSLSLSGNRREITGYVTVLR